MVFKDRLRQLRELNNITQSQLAKQINASQSKIAMWETGNRDPNSEDIIYLADLFKVSTDYLLGRTDFLETPKYQEIFTSTLTENEQELLELFRTVKNERDQYKLIGRFEEIISQITGDFKSNNAQSTPSKKNVG